MMKKDVIHLAVFILHPFDFIGRLTLTPPGAGRTFSYLSPTPCIASTWPAGIVADPRWPLKNAVQNDAKGRKRTSNDAKGRTTTSNHVVIDSDLHLSKSRRLSNGEKPVQTSRGLLQVIRTAGKICSPNFRNSLGRTRINFSILRYPEGSCLDCVAACRVLAPEIEARKRLDARTRCTSHLRGQILRGTSERV